MNGGQPMTDIPRKYIVDEHNKRVAVQLDLATFEKIEETLENYALVQLMKEGKGEETLKVAEAKDFYNALEKAR
jgi:pheromone shutdown protein TraB